MKGLGLVSGVWRCSLLPNLRLDRSCSVFGMVAIVTCMVCCGLCAWSGILACCSVLSLLTALLQFTTRCALVDNIVKKVRYNTVKTVRLLASVLGGQLPASVLSYNKPTAAGSCVSHANTATFSQVAVRLFHAVLSCM